MVVNIMAFGDTHGCEDVAYALVKEWEEKNHKKIDVVLLPGDLDTIVGTNGGVVSNTISDYYSGLKEAPYPTIFVAGNNDGWEILRHFKDGGFIAPNMYFLGRFGYINVGDVRIGGLSGAYNGRYFSEPLPSEPSFMEWQHYRQEEIEMLSNVDLDVLLLHDWIIPFNGALNVSESVAIPRKYGRDNANDNSRAELVASIHPSYVFMGHNHKSYVDGNVEDSRVFGLMRVTEETNLDSIQSYKVISIKPEKREAPEDWFMDLPNFL